MPLDRRRTEMDSNYRKRGYLLPEGCKDLIDALKPEASEKVVPTPVRSGPVPPIMGEITVMHPMTVGELAAVLKHKPFQIVADLLELRVVANVEQMISFEVVAQVLRKYGYTARMAV